MKVVGQTNSKEMTGKPHEKLQVVHLRCLWCFRYHYNTRNKGTIVIVHNTYPDDPMQVLHIFCMSHIGGRYPLGLPVFTVEFNRLRRPTNQYYSQYLERTFTVGGILHDTMAANIPSSMLSLEDISL